MNRILITLFLALFVQASSAQESAATTTEVLTIAKRSWDGTLLEPYPEGQPEITVSRISIEPGAELPVHSHPNPLAAVILAGELTLYKENGTTRTFQAGDSFLEVVNAKHFGRNTGNVPTVLIAFYVGVEGIPITVIEE